MSEQQCNYLRSDYIRLGLRDTLPKWVWGTPLNRPLPGVGGFGVPVVDDLVEDSVRELFDD